MSEFDPVLTRMFAEADMPEDQGFTVRVAHAVARRERVGQLHAAAPVVGGLAIGAALLYVGLGVFAGVGQDVLAFVGLEFARAHGTLASGAPVAASEGQGLVQALTTGIGAGLTQLLLVAAGLAAGAVGYRAAQE